MSSLMFVRDTVSNKNVVLEVNGSNELGVSMSSVPLPTGAATEITLNSINSNLVACNTGAVIITSSALPTGAASETTLSSLDGKVSACDTGAVVVSSSALPTGAASETTLSSLDGKISACDTGAVVVSSSALPSGAATDSNQNTANSALADIKTAVEGTLTVSSGVNRSSGTLTSAAVVGAGDKSSSVDCSTAKKIAIYGNSSSNSQVIKVQVSDDDTTFYETDIAIYPNASAGDFYYKFDACAQYYRLHYESGATMTSKYSIVN